MIKTVPLNQLEATINRDLAKFRKNVDRAITRTAHAAVNVIRQNAPVAFGELSDSVYAEPHRTVVDAPYAAAVERGSQPHAANIDALERWVKLRGMQGLSNRSLRGTTSRGHARRVASQLKAMESGGSLSVDAPRQIAWAIWHAILEHGTRPHWFVLQSLPDIEAYLDTYIKEAIQ